MSGELVSREEAESLVAGATRKPWSNPNEPPTSGALMENARRLAETVVALHDEVERLRVALFDLAWHVQQETEHGRHGTPRYDITLDDLYEYATVGLAALNAAGLGDTTP